MGAVEPVIIQAAVNVGMCGETRHRRRRGGTQHRNVTVCSCGFSHASHRAGAPHKSRGIAVGSSGGKYAGAPGGAGLVIDAVTVGVAGCDARWEGG